jgi:predicted secreted hydrolase
MALADPNTGQFRHQERIARDGWDAWARTNVLDVRHGNWSIQQLNTGSSSAPHATSNEVFQLRGSVGPNTALDLRLEPAKPRVLFGTNGVSRKAADPSAASHYITYPRLRVQGELTLDAKRVPVTGHAWFDHEFSSSQLGEGQVGWDWASIQLKDGREIMAYRMRRSDGSTDPFSTLAWVDRSGKVLHYDARDFQWEPLAHWKSPASGASYPTRVRIRALDPETQRPTSWVLNPRVANQELRGDIGGIAYWEGSCRVENESGEEIGTAYLELTGYDGNLRGRF